MQLLNLNTNCPGKGSFNPFRGGIRVEENPQRCDVWDCLYCQPVLHPNYRTDWTGFTGRHAGCDLGIGAYRLGIWRADAVVCGQPGVGFSLAGAEIQSQAFC